VCGLQELGRSADVPGGDRAVDDVVVDGHGGAEVLPGLDVAVHGGRPSTDAADGHL
jgi:hypothetical protein